MRTVPWCLLALAVFLLPAASTADGPPTRAETQGLAAVAKAYAELAEWCVRNKAAVSGLAVVERGLALAPDDKALLDAKAALEALSGEESAAVVKKFERQRDKTYRKVASYYLKLFRLKPAKDAPGRYYDYLVETIRLQPDDRKAWSAYLGAVTRLVASKDMEGAGRLIAGAMGVGPPKSLSSKFQAVLVKAATDRPVLMKASEHPMEYWLSLPKGYTPRRKWHILVTCEGAGSNFAGNHRGFVNRRGSAPVIVVTPCTLSTTNQLLAKKYNYPQELIDKYQSGPRIAFDEEGILNAIKDVQALASCEEKFFITGFSGGGNPTYLFVFKHPGLLAGAVPCCANFSGQGIDLQGGPPSEGLDVAVRILTGENDPHRQWTHGQVGSPGIEPQTDNAEKLLKKWGYTNYTRTMLPNVKHSPLQKQVIDFVVEKTS